MSETPVISVIMTCYNHEKFIDEAIASILSQTFPDFELIIVDDGSTDSTQACIKKFNDSRIVSIHQKNLGPSVATNNGIKASRGEFIALMSGDDVAFSHRLASQMAQIDSKNTDIVFSVPQIIGPNSEQLGREASPWFYGKEFRDSAELLRELFFGVNFLCAPSCFCRKEVIEDVGKFQRGLIQLQDFEYWIRACKKGKHIRLFQEPLIKYRYLFGSNLSSNINADRIRFETNKIFRDFFENIPDELFLAAFKNEISVSAIENKVDREIDKSFLYLNHHDVNMKRIGIERLINQFENDEIYEKLISERGFGTPELINLFEDALGSKTRVKGGNSGLVLGGLVKLFQMGAREGPRWTEQKVEQQIRKYIDQGDYKRAIPLAKGFRKFPPGVSLLITLRKILLRLKNKISKLGSLFQGFLEKTSLIFLSNEDGIYDLKKMHEWSRQKDLLVIEDPEERIFIPPPKVIGSFPGELEEGEALCPPAYVAEIPDAIVTGGSGVVLTNEKEILSDELADFPGEDYGIKSRYILFKHNNKALVEYKKKSIGTIKEGILLATDHDGNYFHWIVEVLPKLIYIDSKSQFQGLPLLITDGLHKNLESALEKVNLTKRDLIRLKPGIAYKVKRLIYPSALSRINDRYKGSPIFNEDVVFSPKWVSKVSNQLKKDQKDIKPWRKLYLCRNQESIRSLANSKETEQVLLENGFEIFNLDDASFESQIELFSQAAVIIAPSGAALTNILLCQPGTKVIAFMSNHESSNFYFWTTFGNIVDVDVEVIAGERLFNVTGKYAVHDDYSISIDLLKTSLELISKNLHRGDGIYDLKKMHEWSRQKDLLVIEDPEERIFIPPPKVIGSYFGELEEGEALCPPAYVAEIPDAIVIGGSGVVLTNEKEILSDELADFPGEDYGIKSRYILFKHNNKALVEYKKKSIGTIKEGILLATDHDGNYFHWIVEVLPKLIYIDSKSQFQGLPLLITDGLHKNLESALEKVNLTKRDLIRLKPGIAYKVKRLIYPSALSRINDRYKGSPIFNEDVVFSPKWVSKVSNQLKKDQKDIKPWRKLYLCRNQESIRSLANSKETEQVLLENGFEIFNLDDASFESQIELFSQAAVIIAPSGAALTNILLCQPGTKVIAFMSNHESSNFYFWTTLGEIVDVDVEVIVGERLYNVTGKYAVHDDYSISIDLLKTSLELISKNLHRGDEKSNNLL